jgi:SAM-dependent methyltransferase
LLEGRLPAHCKVAEIGCGVGRMTRAFAAQFGEVHAIDISPVMIERARGRLEDCKNVRLHVGSGDSLAPLAGASIDLVFSYIVFQHIPSKPAIENYVREASRVLRLGGVFKFQLNGDQSSAYQAHERTSWQGETFSLQEAEAMLCRHGFSLLAAEGIGTQYFVVTARKGDVTAESGVRPYILAGEAWAADQLLEGFGEAVDQSWRPMAERSRARLGLPKGREVGFFAGIYFWPEAGWQPREMRFRLDGDDSSLRVSGPGDQYFEFELGSAPPGTDVTVDIEIVPACAKRPAFRCMGLIGR